mmetsp:Transcript_4271/g.8873  ORF Transcript_4271/g.8873 Transcript_4271/m.8873 type:complete len:201 (-) Transcript_4271:249-851(-)
MSPARIRPELKSHSAASVRGSTTSLDIEMAGRTELLLTPPPPLPPPSSFLDILARASTLARGSFGATPTSSFGSASSTLSSSFCAPSSFPGRSTLGSSSLSKSRFKNPPRILIFSKSLSTTSVGLPKSISSTILSYQYPSPLESASLFLVSFVPMSITATSCTFERSMRLVTITCTASIALDRRLSAGDDKGGGLAGSQA